MKHKPMVTLLIVLMTIVVFSMCVFSASAGNPKKKEKKKKEYGVLEITAPVFDAAIYIEGINAGTSPLKIEKMKPGIYRVIVKAPGYNDFLEDVEVKTQEISKVDVQMTEGAGDTNLLECDYGNWETMSKNEKTIMERTMHSSTLLNYKNIEVANFEVKSKKQAPPDLLFTFYAKMVEQIDKYAGFQHIKTGYTAAGSKEEDGKASSPGKADQDGETLVLSGVLKKYKKAKKVKGGPMYFKGGEVIGGFIAADIMKNQSVPRFSLLFRLTDKKDGRVVFSQVLFGPVSLMGELFAKTLNDAVESIKKRKEKG